MTCRRKLCHKVTLAEASSKMIRFLMGYVHLLLHLQRDSIDYINLNKTLDPRLSHLPTEQLAAAAPQYTGMPHPPPLKPEDDAAACAATWEVPFDSSYKAPEQFGDTLKLTMCNW
jgi:hypothetical protein